jgi:hypothetical protein
MRNKIFGAIGIIWGGAILANGLFGQPPQGSDAYQAGQSGALVFGGILLVAGIYYFFRKPKVKTERVASE